MVWQQTPWILVSILPTLSSCVALCELPSLSVPLDYPSVA